MNNLPYKNFPFEKIGRVIRASANMESQLESILGALLGIDQFRTRIIAASMHSLTQKVRLIERLSNSYLSDENAEKLNKLLGRVKRLSKRRNMLAHEDMHINMAEDRNIVFKDTFDKQGLSFNTVEFPAKDLDDLSKAINNLTQDLTHFIFHLDGKVFEKAKVHRLNIHSFSE